MIEQKSTVKLRSAFLLGDQPTQLSAGWNGYQNYLEKTFLPKNILTYPSCNFFIPKKDKIVPRLGKTVLGTMATRSYPAIANTSGVLGHQRRFTPLSGQNMEVRTYNAAIYTDSIPGPVESNRIFDTLWTDPDTGEKKWVFVGYMGLGTLEDYRFRTYFDTWYDNTTNQSVLIFASLGAIYRWSGAIEKITNVSGYTISIDSTKTFTGAGFYLTGSDGIDRVMINGIERVVVSGKNTNTITVDDVTGIAIGDLAVDSTFYKGPTSLRPAFDYVKVIANHAIYGLYNSPIIWGSNALNYPATSNITVHQAVQDDLIAGSASPYTGTEEHDIRYVISSLAQPETFSNAVTRLDDLSINKIGVFAIRYTVTVTIDTIGTIDTFSWYVNGTLQSAGIPITGGSQTLGGGPGLVVVEFGNKTGHTVGDTWTYGFGGSDYYQWYLDNVLQGGGASYPVTTTLVYNGLNIYTNSPNGHTLGDSWTIHITPKVENGFCNFYSNLYREPGQAFTARLSSNFWAMDVQENVMYLCDQKGYWQYLEFKLSSNLQNETVIVQPLKQSAPAKPIFPYMVGHFEDYLAFVTEGKTLDLILRKKFIELPQVGYLSNAVKNDFDACSFVGGSIQFGADKRLYITSPEEKMMHCYDNNQKYWQPPQKYSNNGILSLYGSSLISHSNIKAETYTLFDGETGDNGVEYQVIAQTGPLSVGNRWSKKNTTMSFIDGYTTDKNKKFPPIKQNILLEPNGTNGVKSHYVEPKFYQMSDTSALGAGALGYHGLGNDPNQNQAYFQEVYKKFQGLLEYYFYSIGFECTTKSHHYEVISMGVNSVISNKNNSPLVNQSTVVK